MWEKLLAALIGLIEKASVYLEVSTELKRRELGEQPEQPNKITLHEDSSGACEESLQPSQPPESETVAEEPAKEADWLESSEAAKLLGVTPTHLAHCAKEGWVPSKIKSGYKARRVYPKSQIFGKTLDDLRWKAAVERGASDKERRWKVTEMMSAPNCYKAYKQGVARSVHLGRMHVARQAQLLNTYTLMGIEYINLDELGKFTDWWDKNFRSKEKNATADFHRTADPYCVHENDLIWVLTRDYNAQLNPTPEQIEEFNKVAKTLPSIQVRGVRFFKADAIEKIENMRELLSHVEKVEK